MTEVKNEDVIVATIQGEDMDRETKGPRHYAHCSKNNHTLDKYWDKCSKHEWAQIAILYLHPLQLLSPPLLLHCIDLSGRL